MSECEHSFVCFARDFDDPHYYCGGCGERLGTTYCGNPEDVAFKTISEKGHVSNFETQDICLHPFVYYTGNPSNIQCYCGVCGKKLVARISPAAKREKTVSADPIKTISEEEFKMGGYTTKDSGARQEFESGMVRDIQEDKARYDLLDMPMLTRWAELMARGAKKYGEHNWKKAFSQQELDRFRSSALRHMMQWINNETDEDHAAAVYFNIAGAEMVKRKLKDISSWDLRQG